MKQQREVLKKEKETAEKIAARAFAQSYLADLVPSVFSTLRDNGYFYDPVERGNSFQRYMVMLRNYITISRPNKKRSKHAKTVEEWPFSWQWHAFHIF